MTFRVEETGAERRAEALAEDPDPDDAPAVPPR
jgi:hypothetical protein